MTLLIKGGGKLVYDEDNAIEIPKDETPAYFEWTLWRAALAIDHMINKPYEVRGFKLDSDFLPVTAAGGGKGDIKQRLDIIPLSLEQFRRHFISMFENKQARPEHLRELILQCEAKRDSLNAPDWLRYISGVVNEKVVLFSKINSVCN